MHKEMGSKHLAVPRHSDQCVTSTASTSFGCVVEKTWSATIHSHVNRII